MAYNGNSSKIVSSSFLYSTLQTFYTKIKGLLDNKITNNPFTGSGTSGKSGYIAFAQLVITSSYTNRPIEFELICRGRSTPCYVSIAFSNGDTKDPTLSSLSYFGADYGVFAQKTDASTWLLYHKKTESYDNLTVTKIQAAQQGINITYPGSLITEKPTENVTDAVLGYRVGYATSSETATKATKATTLDGLTSTVAELNYCDGVTSNIQTQLDAKASSSHTHKKSEISDLNKVLSNEDLDTIKTVGFYYSGGDNKITNKPYGVDAFGLIVLQSANGWYTQLLYASNLGKQLYTRWYDGSTWTSWVKETYIKNLSISGKDITYTKTDGTTGTITTQDTNTTYSGAGSSLGLVKTGGDVTISSGVITVNDDSHNHIISNVDGLQTQLDNKSDKTHTHSPSDLMYLSTIDLSASTYDQDTYYPVVGKELSTNGFSRIKVAVQLDSGTKPTWSTHDRGFTCNMDLLVVANGWGVTRAQTIALDYSYLWANSNPCGYQQLNCASLPVLWLRGGGIYFVWHDYETDWSIKTSEFISHDDKVSPTKTNPGMQFTYSNVYAHLKGNADSATTLQGLTSTVSELNYVDGVTSNIQTQLNGKASSSHTHSYLPLTGGTINGTLSLSTCNSFRARHVDGSTDGYGGELYLNYNSPDANIYLGNNGYCIGYNGSYYTGTSANAETATNATTSSFSHNLNSSGFGNGTLTYLQTSGDFYDNTGWCHYIIANHGNGESYYNYTIGLPFWDAPMYQRQAGSTGARSGWQQFYTTENLTYGTQSLTPGTSSLKTGHVYLQYE